MTNYGALAILALPKMPDSQFRLLIAIETFPADAKGWRLIGAAQLVGTAHLSRNTVRAARAKLIEAGLLWYEEGRGQGHYSRYRLLFDIEHRSGAAGPEGAKHAGTFSAAPKGVNRRPRKVPTGARERYQTGSVKGTRQNALTSQNANTALEPSALGTSALETTALSLYEQARRGLLRETQQELTREKFDALMKSYEDDSEIRSPTAVLKVAIAEERLAAELEARACLHAEVIATPQGRLCNDCLRLIDRAPRSRAELTYADYDMDPYLDRQPRPAEPRYDPPACPECDAPCEIATLKGVRPQPHLWVHRPGCPNTGGVPTWVRDQWAEWGWGRWVRDAPPSAQPGKTSTDFDLAKEQQ